MHIVDIRSVYCVECDRVYYVIYHDIIDKETWLAYEFLIIFLLYLNVYLIFEFV